MVSNFMSALESIPRIDRPYLIFVYSSLTNEPLAVEYV